MKPRQRTCKVKAEGCQGKYMPFNSLQSCCYNAKCVLENKRIQDAKKAKREARAYRQKHKSHGKWVQEAEAEVRRYVRERDARDKQPCISCGRHEWQLKHDSRGGIWDAGHYLGKGSHPEHRFDVRQIWRQCKSCNRDKSGNQIRYRKGLIARMGISYVEWLEGPHPAKKYTIEELQQIKQHYAKLANELEKARVA
ncbi:MAG: recombination protein NinG [Spongiibacter sp.]|nr:recombination protein NinG [Spongiibacter sp.]